MLDRGQTSRDTQDSAAPVEPFDGGQIAIDPHPTCASVEPLGAGQRNRETHTTIARTSDLDGGQERCDLHSPTASVDLWRVDIQSTNADAILSLAAATLDDLEHVRKASKNRLWALAHVNGMAGTPAEAEQEALVEALGTLEHRAVLNLERLMRKHPLGAWVKRTRGIGDKQGARLIAAIGDPLGYVDQDRAWQSRTVSMLRSYCGYGDPAKQKRQRGTQASWNPEAKMRAHLCAEKCVQAGVRQLDGCDDSDGYDLEHRTAISPMGAEYLKARAQYADAVHSEPCPRCGPKGKAAPIGSPLSDGHKHARALRKVAKEILKDLWREARAISHAIPTVDPSAPNNLPEATKGATPRHQPPRADLQEAVA